MTLKENDPNFIAELSPTWSKYYLCTPNAYPFTLVVRGVPRVIKSYSDHHMIIKSNCERYAEEERARKAANKPIIVTL